MLVEVHRRAHDLHRALRRCRREAEGTGAPAGGANRLQLRMRGRIVRSLDLVDPDREHLAILDQHRAERPAPARQDVVNRERYCLRQEPLDARR